MNTMFTTTILSTSVNNTLNALSHDSGKRGWKRLAEEREDSWACFIMAMIWAAGYILAIMTPGTPDPAMSKLVDIGQLGCYCLASFGLYIAEDGKQPIKAVKTALVLKSVLAVTMLVPFILDMNFNIHVHRTVAWLGYDYEVGYDYTDWGQIFLIGFMVVWCLYATISPLIQLSQMRESEYEKEVEGYEKCNK